MLLFSSLKISPALSLTTPSQRPGGIGIVLAVAAAPIAVEGMKASTAIVSRRTAANRRVLETFMAVSARVVRNVVRAIAAQGDAAVREQGDAE